MAVSILLIVIVLILTCNHSTNSIHILNAFEKPFKIYWNAPTFQCHSKGVYFEKLLTKYGIITNTNGSFKGDKIGIMYDPGNFPAILRDEGPSSVFIRNGGVPQNGNLSSHLEAFETSVNMDFPDVEFDGIAIIDFESWRPIWRQNWGTLKPYKEYSIGIEHELHPTWLLKKVQAEAEFRFETEGRKYVEETIKLGKSLRPRATWGYYAYPYCFNMQATTFIPDCSNEVMFENNRLHWMFDQTDNLHPSIYLPQSLTIEERMMLVEGRIYESIRVKGQFSNRKKIYPYFWFVYRDTTKFVKKEDILETIELLKNYGIDGMIIWGSSNDVNTSHKCEMLYNYIDIILGPAILEGKKHD